jgi:hypothetical protein
LSFNSGNPNQFALILGRQGLFTDLVHLRRIGTEPDTIDLGPGAPEREVFIQIAWTIHLLVGYDPADVDATPFNVLKNPVVGGRGAPHVMILAQAVDRDGNPNQRNLHPLFRDPDDRAGYHQRMDSHAADFGQDAAQFPMANQGLAPYERDLERTVTPNGIDHTSDQIVAPQVA